MNETKQGHAGNATFTDGKIFAIEHSKTGATGVFWNTDIFDVSGIYLESAFARVCQFFPNSIFMDLPNMYA